MNPYSKAPRSLQNFINEVDEIVTQFDDEHELTERIARSLREHLRAGLEIPEEFTRGRPDRYVMYPLHVDPRNRYSIASAVWEVGQSTPVHGHETWGVVGIFSGVEHEVRYDKPKTDGVVPRRLDESSWQPGEVTVCCTTDDDVHQVSCGSDVPCVGIHVYGADIGALSRRSYNTETGETSWFVSTWADPASQS